MSAVPPELPRASVEPSESASDRADGKAPPAPASTDFGPNEMLVDELYQRYLDDPDSVDTAWWNFFADYQPPPGAPGSASASGTAALPDGSAAATPAPATAAAPPAQTAPPAPGAAPSAPAVAPAAQAVAPP